jgi:hypothetical protein
MKTFLKWTGIGVAAAVGAILAARWAAVLRRRADEGLRHMEHVTADARQAVEKTAEALGHTEEAVRAARRTVS